MKVLNLEEAEKNLKSVLDKVAEDSGCTLIKQNKGEPVVLMSLKTFNSFMETFHLLKTPENAAHLMKSINQYKELKNKVLKK